MSEAGDKSILKKGLVHVYTGEGKGKTTAALGVALRVLGWGGRVCALQFIKGYAEIGEMRFAREFGSRFVLKQFAFDLTRAIKEEDVAERREEAEVCLNTAEETVNSGDFDLVILDEVNNAIHYGLVESQRILRLLKSKPEHVEVILTGRGATQEIIEAADYVTEMRLLKHPFDRNIPARKGIDY